MGKTVFLLLILFFGLSCSDSSDATGDSFVDHDTSTGRITLTDRTGKVWDITHAVKQYGFDPSLFRFGLGTNAITPILNPRFISPEENNYPAVSETMPVIGLAVSEEARAYPLYILNRHEVVDDRIANRNVAVAY